MFNSVNLVKILYTLLNVNTQESEYKIWPDLHCCIVNTDCSTTALLCCACLVCAKRINVYHHFCCIKELTTASQSSIHQFKIVLKNIYIDFNHNLFL